MCPKTFAGRLCFWKEATAFSINLPFWNHLPPLVHLMFTWSNNSDRSKQEELSIPSGKCGQRCWRTTVLFSASPNLVQPLRAGMSCAYPCSWKHSGCTWNTPRETNHCTGQGDYHFEALDPCHLTPLCGRLCRAGSQHHWDSASATSALLSFSHEYYTPRAYTGTRRSW